MCLQVMSRPGSNRRLTAWACPSPRYIAGQRRRERCGATTSNPPWTVLIVHIPTTLPFCAAQSCFRQSTATFEQGAGSDSTSINSDGIGDDGAVWGGGSPMMYSRGTEDRHRTSLP